MRHIMKTNIEMKQTAYDNQYTRLKIDDTSQGDSAIIVPLPWQGDRPMSVQFYGACKAIVRRTCRLPTAIARVYDHFWVKKEI